MNEEKARAFADALEALCRSHGVMVWTGIHAVPIMVSDIHPGDQFRYVTEAPEIGSAHIIRRVLT